MSRKAVNLTIIIMMLAMVMTVVITLSAKQARENWNIKSNTVLADALAVESAAKLHNSLVSSLNTDGVTYTWGELRHYVEGIDVDKYDLDEDTVIAKKIDGSWQVRMERSGRGNPEFEEWNVPSACDISNIHKDND